MQELGHVWGMADNLLKNSHQLVPACITDLIGSEIICILVMQLRGMDSNQFFFYIV